MIKGLNNKNKGNKMNKKPMILDYMELNKDMQATRKK